jgi:hypothetical protein
MAEQGGPFAKNVYFASPQLAHHSKAKSLAFSFCLLNALSSKEIDHMKQWLVVLTKIGKY